MSNLRRAPACGVRVFLGRLTHAGDSINNVVGRALSWFLPAMTFLTLVIIIAATVFRLGWVWLHETVVYMHAILFMLAGAYTLKHNEHARIDVFYNRLSRQGQAWVDLCGAVFLLIPTCILIFMVSWPYVADSWAVREHSVEGQGLPAVFLLKTCILLFAALFMVQGIALAAKSLRSILPR